ncbi:alpha/beta hydrolase fold protein [Xylariales sp. PMI_506]|nr:alpha/beta hydrolase fold protein [Xylariales sp. PMI_506]
MTDPGSFVQLRDGAKVYAKILGNDDKRKPLLVALHGAPGLSDHHEPENTFGFLATRFRVLIYDARGSGISDWTGPYSDAQWLEDLDELRAWAGAETMVLAGGSYGSFLSLQYTLAHPERVKILILRGTFAVGPRSVLSIMVEILKSPRINPDAERQVRLWSGNLRDEKDFEDAFAEIQAIYQPEEKQDQEKGIKVHQDAKVEKYDVSDESGKDFEGVTNRRLNFEAQNYAFGYNQPRYDVRDRLQEIKVPTFVAVGRHDPVSPVRYCEEVAYGVQNGQLAIFEKSGHAPPSDEPKAFRERLSKFLSSIGY